MDDELCLVCDDVSSGYHYGVPSCNGCKTFFRRSVVKKQTYTCEFDKNCPVDRNFRCACRFCRFEKCLKVGMDISALQASRDPIGYTKRPKRYGINNFESYWRSVQNREKLANSLRLCDYVPKRSLQEALCSKSLLNDPMFMKKHTSKPNPRNVYSELRFVTIDDYHHWHERDWFVLTEYAKTFRVFEELSYADKVELVRHSAVTVPGLTQVFNSPDHGPDTIVFPDGTFYDRRDEPTRPAGLSRKKIQLLDMVLKPFREIDISFSEFAAFKAITFLNPDANISPAAKLAINEERVAITKQLNAYMIKKDGVKKAVRRFSRLILISTTMSKMACESRDAVWIAEFFENIFEKYTSFAKELFFGPAPRQ